LVTRRLRRRKQRQDPERKAMAVEAARARFLIEESRELVIVVDDERHLVAASRRAREVFPALAAGAPVPAPLLDGERGWTPMVVPYEIDGRREELVYLADAGGQSAYEELRAGFTAAVSHELRTPLARLLVLLESALLPGADHRSLIEQAQAEVEQTRELIDDVLFLSELETGREVVSLGSTRALPVLEEVAQGLRQRADRAGMTVRAAGDPTVELPLRPRMLRVVAQNLAENALRYAGHGAVFELSIRVEGGHRVLSGADDGIGVDDRDLPRLFERFYRADHARASRGTGLGLAIVKHVVTSAGGTVEAHGGLGEGLEIRCSFPA
jgi:two-component system, OmpR family, phosphate regulon sensor histidine kinase PhoR